ncbi:protein FAM186A-like isoform X1 [Esox lucius]|nr:protein FAM186A-like isoform X1 [Esox lucius]
MKRFAGVDMSDRYGISARGNCARQVVQPQFSNRTLNHPSLMPLYMAAMGPAHFPWRPHQQPVPVLTPSEFFYTDPTARPGRRVPNIVTELQVCEHFQLNTPRPIMSSRPASPVRPDPFRTQTHPVRDLGSNSWSSDHLHRPFTPRPTSLAARPRERGQSRAVIQLTLEEDQAITNLLFFNHHSTCPEDPQASTSTQQVDPSEEASSVGYCSFLNQTSIQSIPTASLFTADKLGPTAYLSPTEEMELTGNLSPPEEMGLAANLSPPEEMGLAANLSPPEEMGLAANLSPAEEMGLAANLSPAEEMGLAANLSSAEEMGLAANLSPAEEMGLAANLSPAEEMGLAANLSPAEEMGLAANLSPAEEMGLAANLSPTEEMGLAANLSPAEEMGLAANLSPAEEMGLAANLSPAEEMGLAANLSPAEEMGLAANLSPAEEMGLAANLSPAEEMGLAANLSPPEEMGLAANLSPPEEMGLAANLSPPEEMGLFHREDQVVVSSILEAQHQNQPCDRSEVELEAAKALLTMDQELVSLLADEAHTLDRPTYLSPDNLQYCYSEECESYSLPLENYKTCPSLKSLTSFTHSNCETSHGTLHQEKVGGFSEPPHSCDEVWSVQTGDPQERVMDSSVWDEVSVRDRIVSESEGVAVDALLGLCDLSAAAVPHTR